jgi:hypothetical protein
VVTVGAMIKAELFAGVLLIRDCEAEALFEAAYKQSEKLIASD